MPSRFRLPARIVSVALCIGIMLTGVSLTAFAPDQVLVAQDAAGQGTCALGITHIRAVRPASLFPCPSGMIVRLIRIGRFQALEQRRAYANPGDAAGIQRLITQVPAITICADRALCAGGGGGGGSVWCQPVIVWIAYNDGNVGISGWVSMYGTSDCQAFRVYSLGFSQTYSHTQNWIWHWRAAWTADSGTYVTDDPLPTSTYQTRFPSYWVGAVGTVESFHASDGWSSYDFALRVLP